MSWSLVNKSLELIEGDLCLPEKINSKFMVEKNKSTKDCDVKKINKNVSKAALKKNKSKSILNRKVKSGFTKYESKKFEDKTSKNLKLLNKLDENLKSTVNIDKVKEYNLKKLRKATGQDEKKISSPTKKSKSFFSEEDFEKMNNEWLALA